MSTGTNAGLIGWFLMSCQRMLFTYSFDNARGWRSYQSSTSLSVSNTGSLQGGNGRSLIVRTRSKNGFRMNEDAARCTRTRKRSRSRSPQDSQKYGPCRDQLVIDLRGAEFLLSTFRHVTALSRRRSG